MSAELPHTWELAGLELLAAHCASLDPDTATARERLDEALGPELARKLVFALSAGAPQPRSAVSPRLLRSARARRQTAAFSEAVAFGAFTASGDYECRETGR